MMKLLSQSALALIKTYGTSEVPEAVKTVAAQTCFSEEFFAIPHVSANEPSCYAIICRPIAREGGTIVLCDAEGNVIRGDAADMLMADFGDFIEERFREKIRSRHVRQVLGVIILSLFIFGLGVGFISWILKTDPMPILTQPVVQSTLCVAILLLFTMPWVTLNETKVTELLEVDPEYHEIIWLQSMRPTDLAEESIPQSVS